VFDTNENAEVKIFKDIKGRSAIIVDDFYKDPDEVRALAISLKDKKDKNENSPEDGFPGARKFLDTLEVKEKLYETYLNLCNNKLWKIPDRNIEYEEDCTNWPIKDNSFNSDGSFNIPSIKKNRPFNLDDFNSNWNNQRFMVNVTNDNLLLNDILGVMPHQDYWEDEDSTFQFGSVIYLNTPDEYHERGGTNLYSYRGEMNVPNRMQMFDVTMESWMEECLKKETNIEKFKYLKSKVDEGDPYTVEFGADMKYNRMFLYQANVLHNQNVDLGMFTDYNRISQILFM
jgi:hypothetical protein